MGTSNIYKGPGGQKKLLPAWIDEDCLTEKEKETIVKEWTAAKTSLTKLLNNSKKNSNFSWNFVKHYFHAHGGAQSFVKSSTSLKRGSDSFYSFVYDIASVGKKEAIKNLGEEYKDKGLEEIFVHFSNTCFPNGSDKEESACRIAMINTFELLYKELQDHPDLNFLEDSQLLNIALKTFVAEYIEARILSDLGSSFERSSSEVENIIIFENGFKIYIKECVFIELKDMNFIILNKNSVDIESLLEKCVKRLVGE